MTSARETIAILPDLSHGRLLARVPGETPDEYSDQGIVYEGGVTGIYSDSAPIVGRYYPVFAFVPNKSQFAMVGLEG